MPTNDAPATPAVADLPEKWRREALHQCLMCCEDTHYCADELEAALAAEARAQEDAARALALNVVRLLGHSANGDSEEAVAAMQIDDAIASALAAAARSAWMRCPAGGEHDWRMMRNGFGGRNPQAEWCLGCGVSRSAVEPADVQP